MDISIVLCTHNPRADYFAQTLASLAAQEPLPPGRSCEFILIDNASREPLHPDVVPVGIAHARVVREERLGLTHARLRGFHEARGRIILCVDDDNVLAPGYLREVLAAFDVDAGLGAAGGKALPRYEVPPPIWFMEAGISLACRDLGDEVLYADWNEPGSPCAYPECAPIGAGMAIRREAYAAYVEGAHGDPARLALGRRGSDLASGEDNDMVLSLLAEGWRLAYLPKLSLEHLIPARRLTEHYLLDYVYSSNCTWVQVLALHGICPWPSLARWTLPFRKGRAWLRQRAWRGPVERIDWHAACGMFEGRAILREFGRR